MGLPAAYDLNIAQANESLRAVVEGLEVNEGDIVLAIGGSGDYAFRFLAESPIEVQVIDIAPVQIEYIQWRAEALARGDFKKFAAAGIRGNEAYNSHKPQKEQRDAYFSDKSNCRLIAERLERLVILPPQDIFSLLAIKKFSKIFLSNAYESISDVNIAGRNVCENGRLYCSHQLDLMPNDFSTLDWIPEGDLPSREVELINSSLSDSLYVDVDSTNRARRLEQGRWSPVVIARRILLS
jgi:hypothetical protein